MLAFLLLHRFRVLWAYGTISVTCPGSVMEMTPPQVHISFDVLLRTGMPPSRTVGDPGAHGAGVTRLHLEVEVKNDRALGLYTSLGFTQTSTEDYFEIPL